MVHLFEDHCTSYAIWKEERRRNAIVLHLDAHLDLSHDGLPPSVLEGLAACRNRAEVEQFRSDRLHLAGGGMHCGNYLYASVMESQARWLVWVIPPHLRGKKAWLPWARQELQTWYDMPRDDYFGLRETPYGIDGTIMGQRLSICTIEHLPPLHDEVLLDVDVDYYLGPDETAFDTPHHTFEELQRQGVRWSLATIAYSNNGGYLPLEHRYLGDVFNLLAQGREVPLHDLQQVYEADRSRVQHDFDTALRLYRDARDRGFYPAAMAYKTALALQDRGDPQAADAFEEAARLDPGYRPQAIHEACGAFRRQEFDRALELLEVAAREDATLLPIGHFMTGLIHYRQNRAAAALACWKRLVDDPDLKPVELGAACFHLALAHHAQGERDEAVAALHRAVELIPDNPLYRQHLGEALIETGTLGEAVEALRDCLSLNGRRLQDLAVHRHLVALYAQQGLIEMAEAHLRELAAIDRSGDYVTAARLALMRGRLQSRKEKRP